MSKYVAEYSAYVGNLDCSVSVSDLEELIYELFLQAGPVEKVYLPLDNTTGQHKNHGFVEFEHQESVPYSILLLNGVCLCGRPLRVGTVGKTDVFSAPSANADAATSEGTTMENADAGSSAMTAQDELAAAILAAQLQLGLPLPALSEALGLPLNGPAPLFNCAAEVQPPIQPNGLTPLGGCAPVSFANGEVQPPPVQLSSAPLTQTGPTPLFGCAPFSSANGETRSSVSVMSGPTPLFSCAPLPSTSEGQLPSSSGPTPLFSSLPLPSLNSEMHPGHRLSPPPNPNSPPHLDLPPLSTSDNVHPALGQRLSPPPSMPPHLSLPLSMNEEVLFQRLSPPPSMPPHLSLPLSTSEEVNPLLFQRLSTHLDLPPLSTSDEVHPTLGQRLSPPTTRFGCNPPPPWEQDHIGNGNDDHARAWEGTPNHIDDRSWDEPSNCDVALAPWERSPGIANGNHVYPSHSRWSPDRMAEEHAFCDDPILPWERPPNYRNNTINSFPFPLPTHHSISSHSKTEEEFAPPHSDDTMFSGSHPFASDHTHRHMHQNRVLHVDDKPSWVTKETKEQIRNHHLTKLTETLAQYQLLYSDSKKC